MTLLHSNMPRNKKAKTREARSSGHLEGRITSGSGQGMLNPLLIGLNWPFLIRCSIRALKLRYMMPIQLPSQLVSQPPPTLTPSISAANTPVSSPGASLQRFPLGKADREPPILFDARIVAKKDDGWEDMLEAVLFRWVDKVVDERRVFH